MPDLFDRLQQDRKGDLFSRLTPEEAKIGERVLRSRVRDIQWGDTPEELRPETMRATDPSLGFSFDRQGLLGPSTAERFQSDLERRQAMTPSARAREDRARGRVQQQIVEDSAPDTWAERGEKIVNRLGPLFRQSVGGAIQALIEQSAGPPSNAPLTTAEIAEFRERAEEAVKTLRDRGTLPGQQMYEAATRDLAENEYRFSGPADYYLTQIIESVVQMAPAVATTLATRSPATGASVMFGQVGATQYGESRAAGRSSDAALLDATFMGAAEAIPEIVPLGILMKPGGTFLAHTLKVAGAEGLQEMFTQALQDGYSAGVLDQDMTWGDALRNMIDAGIIGAGAGGAFGVATAPRRQTPGIIETALSGAENPTADDITSPLDTNLVTEGRRIVAEALGESGANDVLTSAGLPKIGSRVAVGDRQGVLEDVFESDDPETPGTGIRVRTDDGRLISEYLDDLDAIGVRVRSLDEIVGDATQGESTNSGQSVTQNELLARMVDITSDAESGGRRFEANGELLESPAGALGEMQVMPGTNRDPGFGVRPAQDDSPDELARVGRDYLAAMMDRYGDPAKAWGAYNWGPGNVDQAVERYGDDWLDHAPAETQAYVRGNVAKLGGEAPSEIASAPQAQRPRLVDEPLIAKSVERSDEGTPSRTPARVLEAGEAEQPDMFGGRTRTEAQLLDEIGDRDLKEVVLDLEDGARRRGREDNPLEWRYYLENENEPLGDLVAKNPAIIPALRQELNRRETDAILPRAAAAQEKLRAFGQQFGVAFVDPGPKKRASILRKLEDEKVDQGVESINDLARGAFIVDAPEAEAEIAAKIGGAFTVSRDKGLAAHKTGYLDHKVILDIDGIPTEVQIVPRQVREASKGGLREKYEQWRTTDDAAEAIRLEEEMRAGYLEAIRGTPYEERGSALISASGNAATNASRESGTPSLRASAGASTQASEDQTQAVRLPSVASTTGLPSTSTNLTSDTSTPDIGEPAVEGNVPRVEETITGKSVAIIGASETDLALVRQAIPNAESLKRKDGAIVYSKKYEAKIREALSGRSVPPAAEPAAVPSAASSVKQRFAAGGDVARMLSDDELRQRPELPGLIKELNRGIESGRNRQDEPFSPEQLARLREIRAAAQRIVDERAAPPRDRSAAIIFDPAAGTVKTVPLGYGAKNRLVTADRADELRRRLKEKMNQLSAGVDPEALAIGVELAIFHIEAGARKFVDFVRAIESDIRGLGHDPAKMRAYLRGWYNGARDTMEDQGEDVSDLDGPGAVRAAFSMLDSPTSPQGAIQGQEATDGVQGTLPARDAGASPQDVQPASEERGAGRPSPEEVGGGARAVPPAGRERGQAAERGAEEPAAGARDRGTGEGDTDRVPGGVSGERPGRRAGPAEPAPERLTGLNWRIEPGSLDESRSPMQKARDNLAAIEIINRLDEEARPATREEQAAIAKYVGWGGLKNAFPRPDGTFASGFESVGARLKELLSEADYDTARRSIQYAHYTSEKVVRPMWEAARRLGFTGGKVFEPGMGTGNFLGMAPMEISYEGLEFDGLTAKIAKALYPESGVIQGDYTKEPMRPDYYDLVIGNPPFSETVIKSDPAYRRLNLVMHDYFFAKSLDQVRPGGLLMFVTSAGTMNKVGQEGRQYLADRADLVGAIRLPGDAFAENAGTQVTTDIVILRKRLAGETPGDRSWTATQAVEMRDRDGKAVQGNVNAYFVKNPEMVLGEQGMFDTLVAGTRYAVRSRPGADLTAELAKAIERLPADVMSERQVAEHDFGLRTLERKTGSYFLDGDTLMQVQAAGRASAVQRRAAGVKGALPAADIERIKGLVPIKEALRKVFAADLTESDATAARAELNAAYDRFIQRFGPINKHEISYRRPTIIQQETARAEYREEQRLAGAAFDEGDFDPSPFLERQARTSEIARARQTAREAAKALGREFDEGSFDPADMPDIAIIKRPNIDAFAADPEHYRLRSIEKYDDETGEAKKGLIFHQSVLSKPKPPEIKSVGDALLYVLNLKGTPDLDEIASRAGTTPDQALDELGDALFENPEAPGSYLTKPQYLSGNVRQKLALARQMAETNPRWERNVRALEAVQPTPLTKSQVAVRLGMPWLPPATIQTFATEALGLQRAVVRYNPRLATWFVEGDQSSAASTSTWGTGRRSAIQLLGDALNRQTPKVNDTIRVDGSTRQVLNQEETALAQQKMGEIQDRFRDWIWADEARADSLLALYNENYNNLVAPEYDGSYLTTPGIASWWKWRPHQSGVIARILQTGNTYMAHGVGAGKTSAMIGAGMEMRRLGLVRKPMYVVPNHMLGQFTKEFYEQYPLAKLMIADERNFHTDRRKQFVADMATEDLDGVIITHSAFGFIPISDEFSEDLIREQLDDYREIKAELKAEGAERVTQRKVEQAIESLEQQLRAMQNRRRDQVFTFEETGVDFLFVDEAHLFRKLTFVTKMGNVKGVDPQGSAMSYDLFAKTRYLESRTPGRSHVLASGTPVTNTMAELFSVQRYLQADELSRRGLDRFDAWAGAFGQTVTALEQDPAGGYKSQTRFASFVNVPELSAMVRQVMDVVTSQQLAKLVVRPTLKGGKRQMVIAQQTPELEAYQETLRQRIRAIEQRSGPPKQGDDILLSVIGDGRKAAIDMRLVNPDLPKSEESKLEKLIENVARIAKETKSQPFHKEEQGGYAAKPYRKGPAVQMVFSDLGINGAFPIHKYIQSELVKRGLKKSEVAIISDYKTHVARQRLFNDMNEGKVRVLIGSVPKMGTGVNAQRQLYAIHNLDPQWYPANDEQRNGRGLRQGNENPEIEIWDYSTKGTYDSQMWQLMETKARFIEGFFLGDPTMRSIDDLTEASQYEQAKALTTADPRIITLTGYRQDLERAYLRQAGHEREQYRIRSEIASNEDYIVRNQQRAAAYAQAIEQRQDISGDSFAAKVGGETFDDRKAWNEAVQAKLAELEGRAVTLKAVEVAQIGGFTLRAYTRRWDGKWQASPYLDIAGTEEDVSKENVASSVASILRNLEQKRGYALQNIEAAKNKIADFTPQLGKEFTGDAEIADLEQKIADLEREIGGTEQASIMDRNRAVADLYRGLFDRAEMKAALKERLEQTGIADRVVLIAADNLFSGSKAGTFATYEDGLKVIRVALDKANPFFVLDHEAIHALRNLGLFRPDEWGLLRRFALRNTELMKSIRERYASLSEDAIVEEAVADMYARRREGNQIFGPFLTRMLDRIARFLDTIRGVFGEKLGVAEYQQLIERIGSGEVGRRTSRPVRTIKPVVKEESAFVLPNRRALKDGASRLLENGRERLDEWRTALQDRMLPLLRTQAAAEKRLARALNWHENPYLGEELMSGKVGAQLDRLADEMVAPLFEAMKDAKISVEEMESYLYARHAPERNAQIAKINPDLENGSGMSDIEAAAIMARIGDRIGAFEKVAKLVDRITKFAVDERLDAGLLSEEQADAWRDAYKHYVPLRGFAETIAGEEGDRPNQGGSGINVRGPESKRAFGRRSKADDIIAYTIMQAEEAIIRGAKNRVARQLYELAKVAPDDEFWKRDKVSMVKSIDKETGLVKFTPVRQLLAADKDWTVSLKIDGKERRVTMNRNNPDAVKLAEAMRRLNEQQMGKLVQFFAGVNRWLSAANTSLNPEFVITNAFRDLQTAAVNLAGFDKKGLESRALKLYPSALVASMRGAFKRGKGEWGDWYQEFVDEGGRVYFNQVKDIDTLKGEIEREFKALQTKTLSPGGIALKAKGALRTTFRTIETVNNGVENAIRLAAYRAAREKGMSRPDAASLAKNLTVNFNRRGASGAALNAFYLFYNASMQGSVRLLLAMRSPRVAKILTASVILGAALEVLNMMVSGEDDDGELFYDKISDFDKGRNLILMWPGSAEHLKIPLPYGYNIFPALGRSAVEMMRGKDKLRTFANLAETIVDAFNPIGGSDSILKIVSPTVTDPVVELTTNEDFAGRPIMPEQNQFGPPTPEHQRYWNSVNPAWRAVTDFLSDSTGGDEVVPGAVDVSPEVLEHLFGTVTGAAGAFYDRTLGFGLKAWGVASGDETVEIERNDIPLVRKVTGEKPGWYDKSAFYTRVAEVEQAVDYAKTYAETGDREGFERFVGKKLDVLQLERTVKAAKKDMRQIREERAGLIAAKDTLDPAEYRRLSTKLRDAERDVISGFNRVYLETVETPKQP